MEHLPRVGCCSKRIRPRPTIPTGIEASGRTGRRNARQRTTNRVCVLAYCYRDWAGHQKDFLALALWNIWPVLRAAQDQYSVRPGSSVAASPRGGTRRRKIGTQQL